MECVIERNPLTQRVEVWLFHRAGDDEVLVLEIGQRGSFGWRRLAAGVERGAPSLTLPLECVEPLVRALSEVAPASDATTAHLKDAIVVRDRLLTLVEGGYFA